MTTFGGVTVCGGPFEDGPGDFIVGVAVFELPYVFAQFGLIFLVFQFK